MDTQIIVNFLEERATWRQERALESPEDYRDQRCAVGLRELAKYVRGLRDDDELIRDLLMLCATDNGGRRLDVLMPGQMVEHAVDRFVLTALTKIVSNL